jgi:hypothetical protein
MGRGIHPAPPWNAHSHVTWQDIRWAWGRGALDMVTYDLLEANPGRKDDILAYVNDALIPAMHEHRSAYICGYTRRYYGQIIFMAFANVGEDPYLAVAYFVAPTRNYLRDDNLNFTPGVRHYLEKYEGFSPDGGLWRGMMARRSNIPCEGDVNVNRKNFRMRP